MINHRTKRPKDYHCKCVYCKDLYKGELIKEDGEYYSARKRTGYSDIEKTVKHLDKGHCQGYEFVIEKYTKKGDTVFDPMMGSGTAGVEALKLGRKALGIELEYGEILRSNLSIYPREDWNIFEGDARDVKDFHIGDETIDLIVTGTVYNNNSDAPERKTLKGKDTTFNYTDKKKNMAFLKDEKYFKEVIDLYIECNRKLKKGGYFAIIIKDPIRSKEPYLLHYEIASRMAKDLGLKVEDIWIHRHYPPTLFINTYIKRFPEVKIPLYQTIVVMKKV